MPEYSAEDAFKKLWVKLHSCCSAARIPDRYFREVFIPHSVYIKLMHDPQPCPPSAGGVGGFASQVRRCFPQSHTHTHRWHSWSFSTFTSIFPWMNSLGAKVLAVRFAAVWEQQQRVVIMVFKPGNHC